MQIQHSILRMHATQRFRERTETQLERWTGIFGSEKIEQCIRHADMEDRSGFEPCDVIVQIVAEILRVDIAIGRNVDVINQPGVIRWEVFFSYGVNGSRSNNGTIALFRYENDGGVDFSLVLGVQED